jgi:small nuclear ribonucleoprotein (snRNP)-like protein
VTFKDETKRECYVKFYPFRTATYPYLISYVVDNKRIETTYTKDGRLDLCTSTTPLDIIEIEEIKPMIDLSQFVDKKVQVTFKGGMEDTGTITSMDELECYDFIGNEYHFERYINSGRNGSYEDIIQIKEIKPMIDLSQFVDKKVRVTFRNGCICEGRMSLNTSMNRVYNPYYFKNSAYECSYTLDGFELDSTEPTAGDIIQIEEIKPMNKYEELEKQVAEMQKEIDRLKREEEENCLNLKPVEIIRTVQVTPEEYYKYCKDYKEKPTATGYVKYYSSSAWFMDSGDYTETFKVMEN